MSAVTFSSPGLIDPLVSRLSLVYTSPFVSRYESRAVTYIIGNVTDRLVMLHREASCFAAGEGTAEGVVVLVKAEGLDMNYARERERLQGRVSPDLKITDC